MSASTVFVPDEDVAVAVVTGEVDMPDALVERVLAEAMLVLEEAQTARMRTVWASVMA